MAPDWVIALCQDWCRQYHGLAPLKQVGKHLKPLYDALPFSQLQLEWRHYLAQTPARFVSIPRFVATHGSYGPPTHSVVWLPSADELDGRAGIPLPKARS